MKTPRIGVGVILRDEEDRVLLGLRQGAHGAGCWSFAGGHLEFGESPLECAKRELLEETGVIVDHLEVGPYTNDLFVDEDKHYVTLFVVARYEGGAVERKEPDKCLEWRWFRWRELPSPLFLPIRNLIEQGYDLPVSAFVSAR